MEKVVTWAMCCLACLEERVGRNVHMKRHKNCSCEVLAISIKASFYHFQRRTDGLKSCEELLWRSYLSQSLFPSLSQRMIDAVKSISCRVRGILWGYKFAWFTFSLTEEYTHTLEQIHFLTFIYIDLSEIRAKMKCRRRSIDWIATNG